jgi:hypothetical protein
MNDKLVTVGTFWNSVDAELARGRLADAGIRAFLADQQTVGMVWYLGNAIGGIKLMVGDGDAEAALEVLSESDAPDAADAPGSMTDSAQPIEGRTPTAFIDDEAEERELTDREENAGRAFRGAVIGLLLMPLQLYVFWLLLKVFFSHEELRADKRRTALWAGVINIPMLIFIGWCWRTL